MKVRSWTRNILFLLGSILVALGLGSVITAGLGDLVEIESTPTAGSIIFGGILALSLVCAGLLLNAKANVGLVEWARSRNLRLIAFGATAVACFAFVIAETDNANTSGWSYAKKFSAGAGVSKLHMKEYGQHFARMEVDNSVTSGESIGAFPISWKVWLVGGKSEVLVRMQESTGEEFQPNCDATRSLKLVATDDDRATMETEIPLSEICGRWMRVEIELPRGTDGLRLDIDRRSLDDTLEIDVMVTASLPNFQMFWVIATVLTIGVLVGIVILLSERTRELDSDPVPQSNGGVAKMPRLQTGGALLLFIALGNLFLYSYVAQERTIYTWDFSGYWMSSRNVSDFLRGAERKTVTEQLSASQKTAGDSSMREPAVTVPSPGPFAALIRDIRFSEYNVTSNLAVAPVMAVLGGSRMVYELSLFNTYALFAVLMLLFAMRGFGGNEAARWPAWWPLIPVVAVFCFVPFWVPIVRGYMGISIVGINLAVLWLYFRQPVRSIPTASLLAIGALLLAGVILQRWNAYWVVAFFVIAAADGAYSLYERRQVNVLSVLQSFRAPIIAGFTAFFLFATVAWPKIVTIVTTDYADIFSAYLEHTSLLDAIRRLVIAFGLGLLSFICLSFAYLVSRPSTRRMSLLLGLSIVFMFVQVSNTQTMGPHHLYLLMPAMFILICLALAHSWSSGRPKVAASGAGALILLLANGLTSGMHVFAPSEPQITKTPPIGIWSQSYRPPLVRNDLDEFIRLAQYIDDNLIGESEDSGVYVLAASQMFNAEHFRNISASTGLVSGFSARVLSASVVDKRDGFPSELLQAHLVVTSIPLQLSRRPSDQQVIRIPAESIFDGVGIGAAFERLPVTFQLDGPVEVFIFRRTRPNTAEELADLSEKLREYYPDRPRVYEYD